MPRLTRPEQTARNRRRVLDAAGKLFRRKGFHGATLEEIADDAGFSKGVIYSQFGSKDDLVLALMEERSRRRIRESLQLAETAPAGEALREIASQHRAFQQADVEWTLLVLEFRVHAARTPELNRRYAALHRKTLEGVAGVFDVLASRGDLHPRFQPADFARFIAALDSGNVLERLAEGPGDSFELTRHALWLQNVTMALLIVELVDRPELLPFVGYYALVGLTLIPFRVMALGGRERRPASTTPAAPRRTA